MTSKYINTQNIDPQHTATISTTDKKTLPYGNWPSAISSELIVSDSLSIDEPKITADSIYYIERRPNEGGRCVIVKTDNQHTSELLPKPFSARSRVHEYGGGCYCLSDDSVADSSEAGRSNNDNHPSIYFVNDKDQDIYCLSNNKAIRITQAENKRFADFIYDKKHLRLISVCETHEQNSVDDNATVTNSIVSIDIASGEISTLIEGHDFFASPRLNPTAKQLCWQSWDHPNMPWDGNQLWLADVDDCGQLNKPTLVAGGITISTFQPQWSPDDVLYYISDDTGWWHLYRYNDPASINPSSVKPSFTNQGSIDQTSTDTANPHNEQLSSGEKEFGLPQWVFGQSTYAFLNSTTIICCFQSQGKTTLAILSLKAHEDSQPLLTTLTTPWQEYSSVAAVTNGNRFCFIAASNQSFPQLISGTLDTTTVAPATIDSVTKDLKSTNNLSDLNLVTRVIQSSCQLPVSQDNYSKPKTIAFDNRHGKMVYANYYPPTNPDYAAESNQQPPLIVICHGGPTGQSTTALDPKKQFWTSRGFALLDVNYSGSTGYGRDYRIRLNNKWGQLDVEDCCDAALYAVKKNLADKNRLIIRGSSAGGFTVLSALTFQNVFSVGTSYYGISELTSLASDTHKFEARYLDRLIGPYPETKQVYQQRSPINHTEQLNCPVIFFQGIEDKVVPKEQAEKMFTALDKRNLPVAAQYFEDEQHGFRKAETIVYALENELSFYQLIFKLKPKDKISFKGDILLKNMD